MEELWREMCWLAESLVSVSGHVVFQQDNDQNAQLKTLKNIKTLSYSELALYESWSKSYWTSEATGAVGVGQDTCGQMPQKVVQQYVK